jgi:hypothetical protein
MIKWCLDTTWSRFVGGHIKEIGIAFLTPAHNRFAFARVLQARIVRMYHQRRKGYLYLPTVMCSSDHGQ